MTDDARTLDEIVYDAWNRLISVQARGSLKDAAIYRYDGTGHRITWHDDACGLQPLAGIGGHSGQICSRDSYYMAWTRGH